MRHFVLIVSMKIKWRICFGTEFTRILLRKCHEYVHTSSYSIPDAGKKVEYHDTVSALHDPLDAGFQILFTRVNCLSSTPCRPSLFALGHPSSVAWCLALPVTAGFAAA